MRINESGRSMIEMLGVLAIIGVLSVGGIAGYTKAMNKYRTNKVIDQVTMIVTNIRTLYAMQRNYNGLTNGVAWNVGAIPDEMTSSVTNAFDGAVTIAPSKKVSGDQDNKAFTVTFGGLTKEACVALATGDWGSGHSAGLIGIAVGNNSNNVGDVYLAADGSCASSTTTGSTTTGGTTTGGTTTGGTTTGNTGGEKACYDSLPMAVSTAASGCGCTTGQASCTVGWKYF